MVKDPIFPLAWESPYAMGVTLKRQKKKKKEKKKKKRRLDFMMWAMGKGIIKYET